MVKEPDGDGFRSLLSCDRQTAAESVVAAFESNGKMPGMASLPTRRFDGRYDIQTPDYHTIDQLPGRMRVNPSQSAEECADALKTGYESGVGLKLWLAGSRCPIGFKMTTCPLDLQTEATYTITPYSSHAKPVSILALPLLCT